MSLDKLVIVSDVVHYRHDGRLFAYGPYAREIDIWADLFPRVEIAAPCREAPPPGDCVPFSRNNITVRPQRETGGDTWSAKIRQWFWLPALTVGLCRAMRGGDAVQVRCPSNLGLLGCLWAPLCCRYRVAKYANQWAGGASPRPIIRMQRALLRSRWWGAPVTVYGEWPGEPAHVHSFFTSMMTSEQTERAARCAANKTIATPLRVLCSGRLAPEKRVAALLEAVHLARLDGLDLQVAVVGHGPERPALERLAGDLGIAGRVQFVGGVPFEDALRWYEWADCLVLPSTSEGWPKVIAEALCHGVICIAVGSGHVPAMLDGRGVVLKDGTAPEIAEAMARVASNPSGYQASARDAANWAKQFSLESLRDALSKLLAEAWGIERWPAKIQRAATRSAELEHERGDAVRANS